MGNNSTAKSFSVLTILTLTEKIIAFVFQAVIASMLGAGVMTDAYYGASELFGVLEVTAISSLTVVALNRFSYHLKEEGENKAFSFLSGLLSFYLPVIAVISAAVFIFALPVSYVISPGFSDEARDVLVVCIRILSVVPVIECFTAISMAVLRQNRCFVITGLKSLFISLVGIAFVVAFNKVTGQHALVLAIAYVVSMLLFSILAVICAAKYGKVRLVKPFINEEIKRTVLMILPLIVSYGISRTALMIGKVIASFLGDGSVSELTYAHSLYAVVSAVFITNISTILLTDFNELISQKRLVAVGQKIRSVTSVMTILLIPITIVSVFCSSDVVKIVYERGSFTPESTAVVAPVLAIYALSFIPSMIHGIYNQVLYANGDTKTPMWIALVSIVINLSVSLALVRVIGLSGVAVGTLASAVAAVVMSRIAVKKFLPDFTGCYSAHFILCCGAGVLVCIAVTFLTVSAHLPAILSFVLSTAVCGGAFILTLLLLREKVALDIVKKALGIVRKTMKKKGK